MSEDHRSQHTVGVHFVPFVSRTLRGINTSRPASQAPTWPLGEVEPYYLDDVENLSEVFAQAGLYQMANEAEGWVERPCQIDGPGTRPRMVPFWDSAQSMQLVFTENLILLCEMQYRLAHKDPLQGTPHKNPSKLSLRESGDLLVSYWLPDAQGFPVGKQATVLEDKHLNIQNTTKDKGLKGQELGDLNRALYMRDLVRSNPLLHLKWGPVVGGEPPTTTTMEGGLAALGPLLPWLFLNALDAWPQWDEGPWSEDLPHFIEVRHNKANIINSWVMVLASSGRLDLLVPFLDLVQDWENKCLSFCDGDVTWEEDMDAICEASVAGITKAFPEARIADRQRARDAQAWMYLSGIILRDLVVTPLRDIHPTERTKCQKWFLTLWSKRKVAESIQRLETVAAHLRGELG